MAGETIAAIEGAKAAGATEIVVKDAHSTGRNILIDQLPEDVRSRVSLREAKKHDTDSIVAYRVIRDATGASGPRSAKDRRMAPGSNVRPAAEALRTSMLEEIAGVVLRERWPYLVADVLKDALENALATASYYVRLAVLARTGDVSCADGTQKTYETLAARHARISLYTALSGALLFLCSAPLAGVALVRRLRGGGGGLTRERCLAWLPVAAFVLANACAFALRADMVHIRYALLAHAALLVLAYRGALDFFFAHGQPTPAVAP